MYSALNRSSSVATFHSCLMRECIFILDIPWVIIISFNIISLTEHTFSFYLNSTRLAKVGFGLFLLDIVNPYTFFFFELENYSVALLFHSQPVFKDNSLSKTTGISLTLLEIIWLVNTRNGFERFWQPLEMHTS